MWSHTVSLILGSPMVAERLAQVVPTRESVSTYTYCVPYDARYDCTQCPDYAALR